MKQTFITSIKILIAIAVLWFLTQSAKLDFRLLLNLWDSLPLLFCTLLIYFVVVIVSAWRWHQLNSVQGIPLSFSHTIIPTYLGIAFNNLLPGGVGGDFFRCYFLFKKITDKRSAIMLSILFDRITGLMGVFIAAGVVALLHLNLFEQHNTPFYFILICLFICVSALIVFFASTLLPQQLGFSAWLLQRFHGKKWLASLLSLLEAIRIYRNAKIVIIKCLSASVVIQLLIVTTCMLIAKMMHFPTISFFDYLVAAAVTQIVNLIPIAPGGFGIGEAAFANVLTLLNPGISATYATIFLAYRIIGIITYLPGVAIFIFDKHLVKQYSFKEKTVLE